MKNFQRWSEDSLNRRINSLLYDIEDWERTLSYTNSFIIVKYLEYCIDNARKEIRAIKAELCYREHNG
jgi:hypothetical protein